MPKYLISFPSGEMVVPDGEWDRVVEESHQVMRDARAAGVYVFGGGIDESVPPVRVHADGPVQPGTYPQTARLEGGYSVLDLPDRAAAEAWAARIAAACRCPQELREFGFDPES
ncbi:MULTISPECIES: transcription initiation protein [unclassified Agrococcus]|uniref:transcription initiation protein n=1 Tax=unclassified Agrococcus TaxID=2615065 RepID=UPI00361CF0CC